MKATRLWLVLLLAAAGGLRGAQAGDALGRLFLTPEQRARIDARVHDGLPGRPGERAAPAAGERLVLNGLLRGSDGRQRLWLNGRGADPRRAGAPFALLRDGRVRVHWNGNTSVLKPGQVLDPATGEVSELFADPPDDAPGPVTEQVDEPVAE